ncbi:MAG TPA: DUF6491 family protein [Steroidobacteraceae bacterium]|nr:DUF6491 family protein [Steroidobacteraceae bacterium]
MKHIHLIATASLVGLLQACVTPEYSSDGVGLTKPEVFIPFASQRSAVTSWQADGLEGVWVEGGLNKWYYARLNGPCYGLDNALRLGFDPGTSDRIDRFSYVVIPNEERCAISSFTESDPPPEGKRRALDGAEVK